MIKAYKITALGMQMLAFAETAGKARYIAYKGADGAGWTPVFTEIRAVRAPEFDRFANGEFKHDIKRCWTIDVVTRILENAKPVEPKFLFVYGTLMRKYSKGALDGLEYIGEGAVKGTLYDFGPFPGYKGGGDGTVYGELHKLPDDPTRLQRLDRYEGVNLTDPSKSLYNRHAVEVTLDSGVVVQAWIYEFNMPVGKLKAVEGGSWSPRER